jgi:thymidylate synthase
MRPYLDQLREILENGEKKEDRTGTGTISLFGMQAKYDLRQGFPLVTTKKVLFDAVVRELLWFIRGSTNINDDLVQHTPIWNAWADPDGELGPIYGYQWRSWPRYVPVTGSGEEDNPDAVLFRQERVDQLREVIDQIKSRPDSRRLIVSAWNVSDIPRMKLPPCHAFFQFYVVNGRLDLQLYQRSADMALGVPFNIASYALLLQMVAQECGLTPGVFTHTLGDAHIYLNHVDGVREQLRREPLPLPTVHIADKSIFDLKFEDIKLEGYQHLPFIKFPVAV